jgi:AcrR family transcriptional regulator
MNKSSPLSNKKTLRRQPQQKRGQQRVEKILIAAAEVFAEVGYAAATVQQIADLANTAVGSIYQFFPDKLAIFRAIEAEYMRQADILDAELFTGDLHRPLSQIVSEFVDTWASYLEQPIPRCIALQSYLPPIQGLFSLVDELSHRQSLDIEKHASLYRQRNPNLSLAKSKLLSEVAGKICNSLFITAFKSNESHRQELYAELKDLLYAYLYPHIGDHLLPPHNNMMICPHCQSDKIAKNGRHQGKQRYICKVCSRQFVGSYIARGYPPEIRQKCLDLHQQGVSFREIERCTGVSHNTVINWVKKSSAKEF